MDPATAVLTAKAAALAASDKRVRTALSSVLAALLLPFFLAVVCMMGFLSGGAQQNIASVKLAYEGGSIPWNAPKEYRESIAKMQECFVKLDAAMDGIDAMAEGDPQDRDLVKAVFYALYSGKAPPSGDESYQRFADCFVRYEMRVCETTGGEEEPETYAVTVAITDMTEIFVKLQSVYGTEVTYEQQANAVNVFSIARNGCVALDEGDSFDGWDGWSVTGSAAVHDLPESANGNRVVQLALGRRGDPYSQVLRGQGSYVDCSYLTMWCFRQVGISLPGTAAEQGRYMVEHGLTISREDLQPGDLIFWSYKPNGRYMNITHVGIYAGDGKVVDASYTYGKVVYRDMFDVNKQVLYGRPQ